MFYLKFLHFLPYMWKSILHFKNENEIQETTSVVLVICSKLIIAMLYNKNKMCVYPLLKLASINKSEYHRHR